MGNTFPDKEKEDKDIKEPKMAQEKIEIPPDTKEPEEKEEKEEKQEKEIEKESNEEKEEKEESQENQKEIEKEEQSNSKEEEKEEEEQPKAIIKEINEGNPESNEEQGEEQGDEQNEEQDEEIPNDTLKTPQRKLYNFSQEGKLYQVDDKGHLYNLSQQQESSTVEHYIMNPIYQSIERDPEENQAINESYEINQEQNTNNISYKNIILKSEQKLNIEQEPNTQRTNTSRRKEPKDSNPKVHIVSKKKKENKKTHITKDQIKSELTDASKNEINEKEITMVLGNGMETGEYKFFGEKTVIKENIQPNEKIIITKEEITNEINKRKNKKKEKKIKYEVIDKFYALTNITGKTIKKMEQTQSKSGNKNYFYSTLNTGNISTNLNKNKKMNNNMNIINMYSMNNYNNYIPNAMMSMPYDNYSRYFLSQINKIRTEPQSFIGVIEDSKANITKDRQGRVVYNSKIRVALNLGEAAFDEAINFLKETKPMQPLSFNQMITVNPPVSESEIMDKNDLSKKIDVMISSGINVKSYWRDVIKDPEISFLLMIIDDNGIKSGMRRKDIMSPYMKYIGISSTEIKNNFVCYVTLA